VSAEIVAAKTGLPPEQVFKTLAAGGPEWNLPKCNFRKPGVELQAARKPDRAQTGFLLKLDFDSMKNSHIAHFSGESYPTPPLRSSS
jgi:hypothetical protein